MMRLNLGVNTESALFVALEAQPLAVDDDDGVGVGVGVGSGGCGAGGAGGGPKPAAGMLSFPIGPRGRVGVEGVPSSLTS